MAESFVEVSEGTGTKLHSHQRVIGANTVEDEVVILGEPYLASYIARTDSISTTTADSHVLQVMAGASLKLRIRRIFIGQSGSTTADTNTRIAVVRLTTAGTGGTAITPGPVDTADAASGATAMTLPTSKGTEGTILAYLPIGMTAGMISVDNQIEWSQLPQHKPIIVPAGTSNGIALKVVVAANLGAVVCRVEFDEANF